ncbi:heat-inducible transcriptional repressor HrcA [Lachnobacterium bovis]|uniref:Heat-inducible transcription repressor HrcA n=1 Tax=Lachnobacterium bovis TaxID=140626 RepID=A0A1H9RF93_9FIRM|nr:heat-inducible transcriptional repressor HrcA [Lachnobacterium bovis]SER71362.1 heat-inducible transcription repressor HrcA [Lachnobacterium bovis]
MKKDDAELLDERKIKILDAIIRNYLATGEPVGSRTISKYTDLNLSSATIRNEMSDLEDLGYILQPHTSAGRIPSDKGYRFYVDHLIQEKDKEVTDMKEFVIEKTQKMEQVLKQVAKLLANNTNYATMITAAPKHSNKVKFVQLSCVEEKQILAVIVMNSNVVRNRIIDVDEPVDNESLLKLNILLNTALNGLSIEEINLGVISKIKEKAGIHGTIVNEVLDTLSKAFAEEDNLDIYTSGATNILKYPELSDAEKVTHLLETFEDKEELVNFVTDVSSNEEETGIQVYIGNESPIQTMKDCSVVTATYDLGEGVKGTVGIIGPKRMDYENVMHNLKSLKKQLEGMFNKNAITDKKMSQSIDDISKDDTV